MAQVLWSAINSGLRNDSCLKEISAVKDILVKMLEDIIQVTCAKYCNERLSCKRSKLNFQEKEAISFERCVENDCNCFHERLSLNCGTTSGGV